MLDLLEGGLRLALGEGDAALRLFQSAQAAEGIGADAPVGIGNVHLRRAEWSLALASFDRALELDLDCAPAHLGRAIALRRRGEPEAAAAAALESIGLDVPDHRANRRFL